MAGGSGVFGTIGKIAKPAGAALSMAGLPMVGIPLAVAGGAMEGGSGGGITGALTGGAKSALPVALGAATTNLPGSGAGDTKSGFARVMDMFKKPDVSPSGWGGPAGQTAFSADGNPLSIPSIRPEAISNLFSSQGNPMTIPANPGGS